MYFLRQKLKRLKVLKNNQITWYINKIYLIKEGPNLWSGPREKLVALLCFLYTHDYHFEVTRVNILMFYIINKTKPAPLVKSWLLSIYFLILYLDTSKISTVFRRLTRTKRFLLCIIITFQLYKTQFKCQV